MLGDCAFAWLESTRDEMEECRFAGSIRAEDGYAGVHAGYVCELSIDQDLDNHSLNTESKVSVEVIFLSSGVGERDVIESDDGRRKFLDVLEVESQGLGRLHLLDESSSLHLVDDLLFRLGLAH